MTFIVCSCHDEDGIVPFLVENETLNGSIFIINLVLLQFLADYITRFHPTQIFSSHQSY